jgi:hypothetical protein
MRDSDAALPRKLLKLIIEWKPREAFFDSLQRALWVDKVLKTARSGLSLHVAASLMCVAATLARERKRPDGRASKRDGCNAD